MAATLLLVGAIAAPAASAAQAMPRRDAAGSGTEGRAAAVQPRDRAPALAAFLDAHGRLAVPEGFCGSLDAAGFRIASGEGEPLRFAASGAKAVQAAGAWSSLGAGTANGVDGTVFTVATLGSDVYAGGGFFQAGGAAAFQVARFNDSTQAWTTLGPAAANGTNGNVRVVAAAGTDVYVGGVFDQAGGIAAKGWLALTRSHRSGFRSALVQRTV